MAGWDGDFNNGSDDVLKLNLFARKSFGFTGISTEKEETLKRIVTQLGASCDDYPKYTFTSAEHYDSLTKTATLYNVTYIRDCVDANRCLTIENYKFGPKPSRKKEYIDFEPCCANFHTGSEACRVCDPTVKTKVSVPKAKTKKGKRTKSTPAPEASTIRIKKEAEEEESKEENPPAENKAPTAAASKAEPKAPWEPWENRMLIDYLIYKQVIPFAKGPNVYKKMHDEGFLKNRTPDSMRVHFRIKILKNIESYKLAPAVLKEFKKLRTKPLRGRRAVLAKMKRKNNSKNMKETGKKGKQSAKET